MKNWLLKIIESCFLPEQLQAAEILVSLYILRLQKEGKDFRQDESELLEAIIKKNDLLTI